MDSALDTKLIPKVLSTC